MSDQASIEKFQKQYYGVREQVAKAIVGHDEIVDGVLTCLFAGGHALLEGVPGLRKSLSPLVARPIFWMSHFS